MSYMCDQEGAVRTCMQEALEVAKGRGEWTGAMPDVYMDRKRNEQV